MGKIELMKAMDESIEEAKSITKEIKSLIDMASKADRKENTKLLLEAAGLAKKWSAAIKRNTKLFKEFRNYMNLPR